MLRSKSALRLSSNKQPHNFSRTQHATWPACLLAHKLAVFWGLAGLWLLYLAFTAVRRPHLEALQHSRSLLQASTLTGRLEAIDLGQHTPEALRAAVRQAVSQDESAGAYDPLLTNARSIVSQLEASEERVECSWDPTLNDDLRLLQGERILLAANFRDNQALLPHLIVQLWHVLALLPTDSAFVSVYESGSTDSTGAWLEVLRQLISAMHVPHRILTGGSLTRGEKQDRIDFLAQVRNAALEPLWLNASTEAHAGVWQFGGEKGKRLWPATKVVFMNDVYFCAKDVIRLLLHKADMACGMDFDRRKLDQIPTEEQRKWMGEFLWRKLKLPKAIGRFLALFGPLRELHAASDAANEVFREKLPMGFYDTWVSRDSDGNLFRKDAPYATDPYSLMRIPWGLPFPVKCCWNGLVALNAAPFVSHDLRVRMHKENECAASECSLLCNDYLRLGYDKFVVDPGVRQAYTVRDSRDLYDPQWVPGINVTRWADVVEAPPIDMSRVPFRPYYQCCGLKPGNNMIEFDKDCAWDDFLTPNYTAMAALPPEVTGRPVNQTLAGETAAAPLHAFVEGKPGGKRRSGKLWG